MTEIDSLNLMPVSKALMPFDSLRERHCLPGDYDWTPALPVAHACFTRVIFETLPEDCSDVPIVPQFYNCLANRWADSSAETIFVWRGERLNLHFVWSGLVNWIRTYSYDILPVLHSSTPVSRPKRVSEQNLVGVFFLIWCKITKNYHRRILWKWQFIKVTLRVTKRLTSFECLNAIAIAIVPPNHLTFVSLT